MKRLSPHLQRLITVIARGGYLAKGIVYLIVGGLAALAAAGLGGSSGGTKEALNELARQPFGGIMLGAMALGLFAYALWRLVQALLDAEDVGHDLKGIGVRLGFVISGAVYAGLGVYCIDLLRDVAASSGEASAKDRTAELMSHPGGIYLVFAVGLVFLGVGLRQLWRAITRSYLKNWHMVEMSDAQQWLAEGATRWGLSARGLVFLIIGLFLCIAALRQDPDQAQGLGGALQVLARQPFGPWLLGAVALGLMGYGAYCIVNARFRDVSAD